MEFSNVVTSVLTLILIMFVFVVMVNFIIPFKLKSDFDDVSSAYHMVVQLEGGISANARNQLEKDLTDMGMTDIDISCKAIDEVRYGERFEFYVKASINTRIPNQYLLFEDKEETLEFRRVSFSKKLVN